MKTILIADDHDHLRLLVSKTLGGADYRILEARDGNEACEIAAREALLVKPFSPIELMETVEKLLGESGCG